MFLKRLFFVWLLISLSWHMAAQQLWVPESQYKTTGKDLLYFKLQKNPQKKDLTQKKVLETQLEFPNEYGVLETFRLKETEVLSPELQLKHPWIRTHVGYSTSREDVRIRVSQSKKGYWVWMQTAMGDYFMQPSKKYPDSHVWYKRDEENKKSFKCSTPMRDSKEWNQPNGQQSSKGVLSNRIRTFDIAVATTGEYGAFWADEDPDNGTPEEDVLAEIVRSINRINEVFETDLQVHLRLVTGTEVISLDPASDPFNGDVSLNTQIQNYLDTQVGNANYDLGHLLDYDAPNGNAGSIGNVCRTGSKGSAFSAHDFRDAYNVEYLTDYFDLDFFGHELGHQFGGTHTFGFSFESAGANMEPGSGSTIMAYAGITGTDDVQNHGDAYFHYKNIHQINTYINTQSCQSDGAVFTNTAPQIAPLTNVTIPQGTAYKLSATVTDSDSSDQLYYCWEQLDNGRVRREDFGPTKLTGAMARSRPPVLDSVRYIPEMSAILGGNLTQTNPTRGSRWETVSTIGRDLNWGLTVRDRFASDTDLQGRVSQAAFEISVHANSGPFVLSSQDSNTQWSGGQLATIRWDVAQTNRAPVNASHIRILLSTDGGQTFPHILEEQTPNDGVAEIVVPLGIQTAQARLLIEPVGNLFLAVNQQAFPIERKDVGLRFNSSTIELCTNASNQIPFELSRMPGQSGNLQLSVIGQSNALTLNLPQSQFSSGQTTGVLEISNLTSIPSGNYMLRLRAQLAGQTSSATVADTSLNLNIRSATLNPPNLQGPEDGRQDLDAYVTLNWNTDANASSYSVELSTDQNFSSLTFSSTTADTQLTTPQLDSNTTYYWRVKAMNSCGESVFSTVRSFRTQITSCHSYSTANLPRTITDATTLGPGVTLAEIFVQDNLSILDLEIEVDISHTWLEDLALVLIGPNGQRVQLTNRIGENQDNYRRTIFDQESDVAITSGEPPYTGRFRPIGDLSVFYNTDSGGTWILEITDNEPEDVGSLRTAELSICYNGVPESNSDRDVFPDSTDNCPLITNPDQADSDNNGVGNLCDLYDAQNLTIQKLDATCATNNNGEIRIQARAQFEYSARLEGISTNLTKALVDQQTSFTNLAPGNYRICVTSTADATYEYCFQTTVGAPETLQVKAQIQHEENLLRLNLVGANRFYIQVADQDYEVNQPGIWTTPIPDKWTKVVVTTDLSCQGKFSQWINGKVKPQIAPNPAETYVDVFFPEAGVYDLYLMTTEGDQLFETSVTIEQSSGTYRMDLSSVRSGAYIIQVYGEPLGHTFKLIKK